MRIGNLTIKIDDGKKGKPASAKETLDAGYKEKYWKEYGKELEVENEIKELGIEEVENGEVNIPEDLAKQMGLEKAVTAESEFHRATDFQIAGISLTDDQLSAGKKQPVTRSLRWLVEWFIYELLKARFIVTFIKGRIKREKGIGHKGQGKG
ncbi:MAG: hypothetical protein AAB838_01245 [Patescibacteria group bacterium]